MAKKKIVIIGAGIAGLSTGIYALKNGYDVDIFEMHTIPGGNCCAWKRKGYMIDGCVQWLCGSKPGTEFNNMWREIGADVDVPIINHEYFLRYEDSEGMMYIYSDMDRLAQHLTELAPKDASAIRRLTSDIKKLSSAEMPADKPEELYTFWDGLSLASKSLSSLPLINKYSKISVGDYMDKNFKNERIKKLFTSMVPKEYSMTAIVFTLGEFHRQNAGYPIGGSLPFILSIERQFKSLGGNVHYRQRVTKIITSGPKATGIILENGENIESDYVVSASDGYSTIFKLLEGKFLDDNVMKLYHPSHPYKTFTSIQVSLGINRYMTDEAHKRMVEYPDIQGIGGITDDVICYENHSFDPTLEPEGKTLITCLLSSDFYHWQELYDDTSAYKAEKDKVANAVIDHLDSLYPGIRDDIEMVDVATPMTYLRYTGAREGAYMAFMQTPETGNITMPTIKGLENFYMAGMWAMSPGGLPVGLMTGRWTVQRICHQDRKVFKA